MQAGDLIRITAKLGLTEYPGGTKFVMNQTTEPGEIGVYVEPHPSPNLPNFWHVIRVERSGGPLYCPAHVSQFEVVDE